MAAQTLDQGVLPPLRHGQIVCGVLEYVPTGTLNANGGPTFTEVKHDLVIVLTPECDLLSDFIQRDEVGKSPKPEEGKVNSGVLSHVQCCDLLPLGDIRWPYPFNRGTWDRVHENRDERYLRVPAEDIRHYGHDYDHPDLYLDFKRVLSVPTDYLYAHLNQGKVGICGRIPEPWLSHLVQRCYGFQSRVCLPDPSDTRAQV